MCPNESNQPYGFGSSEYQVNEHHDDEDAWVLDGAADELLVKGLARAAAELISDLRSCCCHACEGGRYEQCFYRP